MCSVCCAGCCSEFYLHSSRSVQCFSLYTSFVWNTLQCKAVFCRFSVLKLRSTIWCNYFIFICCLILQNGGDRIYCIWIQTKEFRSTVEINHNCTDVYVSVTGNSLANQQHLVAAKYRAAWISILWNVSASGVGTYLRGTARAVPLFKVDKIVKPQTSCYN